MHLCIIDFIETPSGWWRIIELKLQRVVGELTIRNKDSFIQSWSPGFVILYYSFTLFRIRWNNFIRRTTGVHLFIMLINHHLRFIHCDFSFYLLTSNFNQEVRYIKSIHTLQSDSYSPIASPFPDKWVLMVLIFFE